MTLILCLLYYGDFCSFRKLTLEGGGDGNAMGQYLEHCSVAWKHRDSLQANIGLFQFWLGLLLTCRRWSCSPGDSR